MTKKGEHKWKWSEVNKFTYCEICGVIINRDKPNKPCKGEAPKVTTRKKKEWAWSDLHGDNCVGPFASRKDALLNAKENSDYDEILLGYASWPRASEYIPADYDDILQRTDENAFDDACFDNGEPLFIAKDAEKARNDLKIIMMRWATKWLEPTAWTFRSGKKVKIR